ncbi:hypothetical protein HYW54_03015 [Candidatus Gottesmanbacteria bacterium]|nr:hypothetical protein [Candidatus Gottesmanbacteria bacterium]
MIDATTSALLQKIADNLRPLEALDQPISAFQVIGEFIPIATGAMVALLTLIIKENYDRYFHKSRLVPVEKPTEDMRVYQEPEDRSLPAQWIYRLELLNDSNYIAKNVEIYIQEVYDNGANFRKNFIPSPLRWTHRDSKPRNIFPHQTVLLDLFEIKFRKLEPVVLAAPNLEGLKNIRDLRAGKMLLILKYFQQNGQTGHFEVKIEWNGNEPLILANQPTTIDNLPTITNFTIK